MHLGYELTVAWRYLRERGRRVGYIPLLAGIALLVVAVTLFAAAALVPEPRPADVLAGARNWKQYLEMRGVVLLAAGVLVAVFGFLYRLQSIFTTISTYGVFLGTTALVIVLSVMNGFEVDLRRKILGSNAHVLVTKEDGPFTEWRSVERQLDGACARGACVVAHSPYLTSEVVVAANQNYGGVIIKGIDPATIGRVTDLERNLSDGSSLARLWPVQPGADGQVDPPVGRQALDAAPEEVDGEDDEPIDFSGAAAADAGPATGSRALGGRPIARDPRVSALDGVIVGRELAKNLHLYVGQEVQVVSPLGQDTPAGPVPRTRPFRVAGTFYSGMYEYDTKVVYVTLPALQRFLAMGDEVTGIEVKTSDIDETEPLVRDLARRLGPGYRVQDWKELNRNLFSALKLEKIAMFSVLGNIIVVACLSIILNLIMVVVEKGREIAILKSMGASDRGVMRIFILEGLYIGVLGTGFGLLVGVGTCAAIGRFHLPLNPDVYYIDKLPVAMDPVAIAAVALVGIGISVLATLYPSYVGARLRPVEGLRYQ